jgi:hypothetical protein
MTTTEDTMMTIGSIGHEDRTARIIFLGDVATTVADDPDTNDDYCLSCQTAVVPMLAITVIDGEQWEAAPNAASMCPLCGGDWLCREDDADQILREHAADEAADRLYHERRDEGYY